MYIAIEFTGNFGKWEKFPPEDYATLRQAVPTLPATPPNWEVHGVHYLTMDNAKVLAKYGISFEVSKSSETDTVGSMLVTLQNRIAELELEGAKKAECVAEGACVQIHVPDQCLMKINEVQVIEDCCTDRLQDELNDGWRILAVCPPNAKRRPDYVLGRKSEIPFASR